MSYIPRSGRSVGAKIRTAMTIATLRMLAWLAWTHDLPFVKPLPTDSEIFVIVACGFASILGIFNLASSRPWCCAVFIPSGFGILRPIRLWRLAALINGAGPGTEGGFNSFDHISKFWIKSCWDIWGGGSGRLDGAESVNLCLKSSNCFFSVSFSRLKALCEPVEECSLSLKRLRLLNIFASADREKFANDGSSWAD